MAKMAVKVRLESAKMPFWQRLEGSGASLGRVLELLGALSGALEALSGALGAVLGPSCGSLRRLKTQIGEMSKTFKHLKQINMFGGSAGPRCGQVGPS